jgi:hypothetical protein
MEKLSEIWQHIRDRLSNPFIFSFLVSWLVFNWKVIIGLFWYDAHLIEQEGYTSYFDFIDKNVYRSNSLENPLVFALGYTVGLPILKQAIDLFQTFVDVTGTQIKMKLTGEALVPGSVVVRQQEEFRKKTAELVSAINDQKGMELALKEERASSLESERKNNELNRMLSETDSFINALEDVSFMDGEWEVSYPKVGSGFKRYFQINGGQVSENVGESRHVLYTLQHFYQNIRTKRIHFVKYLDDSSDSGKKTLVNDLKHVSDDRLEGMERGDSSNPDTPIFYSRLQRYRINNKITEARSGR